VAPLDTAFVADRVGDAHVAYTPRAEEAVAAVDRGEAEAAFLLRRTRIEDVFAVAERGETMPQKSTYFYPKLVSGLLFHPLRAPGSRRAAPPSRTCAACSSTSPRGRCGSRWSARAREATTRPPWTRPPR